MRPGDEHAVFQVAQAAWRHTYKDIYPPDYIERHVNESYSPEALQALFPGIQDGSRFFWVAFDGKRIVGFCHIADRGQGIELVRLYALPEYIDKGTGKEFLRRGEEFIHSKSSRKYFCYVHSKNNIGMEFYKRNGFCHTPERDKDPNGQWCMEKQLT